MSTAKKTPQSVNTSQDPALEYLNQRAVEVAITPTENSTKNVVYEEVTQVITNVFQVNAPSGANGQLQFNQGGQYIGDAELQYNPNTDTLTTGKIVANIITITGNASSFKLNGGFNNEVLRTDGNGNLSWANVFPSVSGKSGKFLVTNGVSIEWSNSNYNSFASTSYVDSAIATLVGTAPAMLDTLGEIANIIGQTNDPQYGIISQLANKANVSSLAQVAFSGSYADLSNRPNISTVGNTGNYSDLNGKPTIPASILDLGISDGTNGQVLTTYGNGRYHFTTVSGGGGSSYDQNLNTTDDVTFNQVTSNTITQITDSNLTVQTSEVVTTNDIIENGSEFAIDQTVNGFGVIPGWSQRNSQQIEVNLFVADASVYNKLLGLSLGADVIVTYSTLSGDQTFTSVLSQQFTATGQADQSSRQRYSGRIDGTLPAGQTGIVSINFPTYTTNYNDWTFGTDSTLTVPGTINRPDALQLVSGGVTNSNTASVNVYGNIGKVILRTGDNTISKFWEFNRDGNLKLPAGGDILDSTGNSVLGGGASTGNITFTGDNIGSSNDVVNIVGNDYAQLESNENYIWVEETYAKIEVNNYGWTFHDDAVLTIANGANISQTTDDITGQKTFNITPSETSDFEVVTVDGNIRLQTANSYGVGTTSTWTFDKSGNLVLPQGTILSETANSTSITPPNALAGQSLVVRLTGATGIVSDHPGGFTDGDTITLTVTPDYNFTPVTGTVDYTFTDCTSVELGRALTGTLTFTSESAKPISWTIPVSSTMTTFTITLSNASGFDISTISPLTLTSTGSSEDHHIHLIAGDPTITDIYLGDDDQYVKIEKNGGNVLIGTNLNTKLWKFGTDGNLQLPAGGDIVDSTGTSVLGGGAGGVDVGAFEFTNSTLTATGNGGDMYIKAGDDLYLDALEDDVHIRANDDVRIKVGYDFDADTAQHEWRFDTSGYINFPDGSQQNTAYTGSGGGNSISDGTSNVTVTSTDGNVVIGVNNDAVSWTFATDGIIYNKSETDYKVMVTDPNNDGYGVKHYVNDGNEDLSSTSLTSGQFSIYTDLPGGGYEWRFSGNTLQVSNDSIIRGFDSNVTIQSMYAGGAGTASLQSVSNANDPNIYSTFDATTTGANIKVYNGGSNSGVEHAWQFGTNGVLTLPQGSQISETAGVSTNITANGFTWAFDVNGNLTLPNSATIIAPASNNLTVRVTGQYNVCTLLTGGSGYGGGGSSSAVSGGSGTGMIVGYGYGLSGQVSNVGVTDPGTGYQDGDVLTMTAGDGTATFVITKYNTAANAGNNNTAPSDWIFGTTNNLTLPLGGDILDSTGNSVLGGGGTSLPSDAVGYLRNDGSGTLSWNTSTVTAGSPAYSDVWQLSLSSVGANASFWTTYSLTGNIAGLMGAGNVTVSSQTVYGKQVVSGSKTLLVNDGQILSSTYGVVIEMPANPVAGDTLAVPAIGGPILNKLIFKPASGQRMISMNVGGGGNVTIGSGTSSIASYATLQEVSMQPITWVFAGTVNSYPTWYQMFF